MNRPPPTPPFFPSTTLFRSSRQTHRGPGDRDLRPPPSAASRRRRSVMASGRPQDRKSTRLNSSHMSISYAVFCLKNKSPHPLEQSKEKRRYARKKSKEKEKISSPEGFVSGAVHSFFFNEPAPPDTSILPLHDALPIFSANASRSRR